MNGRVRVWCLRHAESENVTADVAGAVPWAPLTSRGRDQAAAASRVLGAEPITKVYASTALRARQSAGILAAALDLEVTEMTELAEVEIGEAEGTTDPDVRKRTAGVLHAWVVQQDLDQRVADGESGHQVVARMTTALKMIADAHPGETVAVVGHVASLTVSLGLLLALPGMARRDTLAAPLGRIGVGEQPIGILERSDMHHRAVSFPTRRRIPYRVEGGS